MLVFFSYNHLGKAASLKTLETNATLNDYWLGKAEWNLIQKLLAKHANWSPGYGSGARIKSVGNKWYLFSRKINLRNKPSYCPYINETMGIEVRKSTDHGRTWSVPVDIITADEKSPWECMATDGDVYYNSLENKWRLLFQCIGRDKVWNGCYAERSGKDPMGKFTQATNNPVIPSKSLWSKICDTSTDDCSILAGGTNKVFDEGTFDIFDFDGAYYAVDFHGYDGKHGYRGIAKTKDFIVWIAGDEAQGVPKDAFLDAKDLYSWKEQWQGDPIGVGAGVIVKEGNYYYSINEGADINLGCVNGQNWDWGIFRSTSLTNTHWEQLPQQNPFLYSSKYPEIKGKSGACNTGYAGIFFDKPSQKYYLHFTRNSNDPDYSGIYIFELNLSSKPVKNANLLSSNLLNNANLRKCTTENWSSISPKGSSTVMDVLRDPEQSLDANCMMSVSCGASTCLPGQSIYQDVTLSKPLSKIRYGGKFASNQNNGEITLSIFEFDQNNTVIKQAHSPYLVGNHYTTKENTVNISSQTKKLRFQVYINSPAIFKFDEMYLLPKQ